MSREKKKCSVDNCDRDAVVKGMCDKHYRQVKKHGRIIDNEKDSHFIDRTGEEGYNTFGTKMIVIECKSAVNMTVEFQDKYKYKKKCAYKEFKNGNVKNPYDREIYGVGYFGVGKYDCKNYSIIYQTWRDMIRRCYDPYAINKHLAYKDCFVCEEWHNYQNFAKWYEENYYECNNEKMELDKDILVKGNKIYGFENCLIVPKRINDLFIQCNKFREKYPIGVSWHKTSNKFCANCNIKDKKEWLGLYDSIEEAFEVYKIFKENYIKQIADEYKDLIPKKLYEALYKYEVEIND